MVTGARVDPYGNFQFLVELDGITRAAFRECSGLDSTTDVIEYREGGENKTTRKLPGITKYTNITLRWGVTDEDELFKWHQSVVNGQFSRKNGSIVLLDREGNRKKTWTFVNAWPVSWKGPEFNATASEIAIETLEIAHEGLQAV